MGEYEERYPDAYGRDETAGEPPTAAELNLPPRQHRQTTLLRARLGIGAAAETAPAWQHAPSAPTRPAEAEGVRTIEPTAPRRRAEGSYRGLGPRGYTRSDQRIYEDVCDRLTDNPFIDASDIEVTVRGGAVTLAGSIDNMVALRQAEEIAWETAGVGHVRNELIVSRGGEPRGETLGDQVNRAIRSPGTR